MLLLWLLHPFIGRVLSGAHNNNYCCRGKYADRERNLNAQRGRAPHLRAAHAERVCIFIRTVHFFQ